MGNVEALKALYVSVNGDAANVENASTIVDVLNAIAAMFGGKDDATTNPEAIENITAVTGNIQKADFTSLVAPYEISGSAVGRMVVLRSSDGVYDLNAFNEIHAGTPIPLFILLDPAKKIIIDSRETTGGTSPRVTFTPAEDYDGFYNSQSTKYVINESGQSSEMAVTGGDGLTYWAWLNFTASQLFGGHYDAEFSFILE